jgi:transposase
VLERLCEAGLVNGNTIGIDTRSECCLRSIVRRDTGETYEALVIGLAKASGIETPTREDLARVDRKRPKKGSNDDWTHPEDPDARITKMKDGRTHLAHKAEHAVDLETGAVVAITIQRADKGDSETAKQTLITAAENIETVTPHSDAIRELVGDKGYHSNELLKDLRALGIRSYIAEPHRGRRNWEGKPDARKAVYANRRRIRGNRGRRLLRQRGERLERPFAHAFETGGLRRVYLRGGVNILKRVLIHFAALNLALLMRVIVGVGTPRTLQGRVCALFSALVVLWRRVTAVFLQRFYGNDRQTVIIHMPVVICR